jgi:ATP-binding cassette subfamily F protein 3
LINLTKSFGGKILFQNCTLSFKEKEKVALVGKNGVGKTTFLRIILGEVEPDAGEVIIPPGQKIGYLPQEINITSPRPLLDEVLSFSPELLKLEEEKHFLEKKIAEEKNSKKVENLLEAYGQIQEKMEFLAGYDIEAKAEKILVNLGFKEDDFRKRAKEFSGGWSMRIALAKLLLLNPEILLLDEPTNHLDLFSLLWLEEYLLSYQGTVILTSHDRDFLNKVTSRTLELEGGKVTSFPGNFDFYHREKEKRVALLKSAKKTQERKIAQLERFIERFRAKNTRAKQVQSRIKALEKIERIEVPSPPPEIHFTFPQPTHRGGKETITLENIKKSYGKKIVYQNLNLTLYRGDKVVLVGANGAGKSTLLKILAGKLEFEEGKRKLGYQVKVAYYTQHRLEMLKPDYSVWEEITSVASEYETTYLRKLLGCFLFSQDDIYKKVKVLSGGEKSRLALAKILLNPPNLLLMDEPVNHLDMTSRDVLKRALCQYQGTLCFISHDVNFIQTVANKVIEIKAGQLFHYPGDITYYLGQRKKSQISTEEKEENKKTRFKKQLKLIQKKEAAEKRNKLFRVKKKIKEDLKRIEENLAEKENKMAEINHLLVNPTTYKTHPHLSQLVKEQARLKGEIEKLNEDWLKYSERLEELENLSKKLDRNTFFMV